MTRASSSLGYLSTRSTSCYNYIQYKLKQVLARPQQAGRYIYHVCRLASQPSALEWLSGMSSASLTYYPLTWWGFWEGVLTAFGEMPLGGAFSNPNGVIKCSFFYVLVEFFEFSTVDLGSCSYSSAFHFCNWRIQEKRQLKLYRLSRQHSAEFRYGNSTEIESLGGGLSSPAALEDGCLADGGR